MAELNKEIKVIEKLIKTREKKLSSIEQVIEEKNSAYEESKAVIKEGQIYLIEIAEQKKGLSEVEEKKKEAHRDISDLNQEA